MRTTLELPDDLLKRAKIGAVTRGITLKELVARGLERELDSASETPAPRRAEFPVFRARRPGARRLTPDDIRRDELDEDLRLSEPPR